MVPLEAASWATSWLWPQNRATAVAAYVCTLQNAQKGTESAAVLARVWEILYTARVGTWCPHRIATPPRTGQHQGDGGCRCSAVATKVSVSSKDDQTGAIAVYSGGSLTVVDLDKSVTASTKARRSARYDSTAAVQLRASDTMYVLLTAVPPPVGAGQQSSHTKAPAKRARRVPFVRGRRGSPTQPRGPFCFCNASSALNFGCTDVFHDLLSPSSPCPGCATLQVAAR